jgi:predicted metal-dependent phosphoesterase TrpH
VSILNADLHCHSVVSDGTMTPEDLAARAAANGVELWALTDHDEIGGQHRAAAAARERGMKYLTGTEISVTFANVTVHIVGWASTRTTPPCAGPGRHPRRARRARHGDVRPAGQGRHQGRLRGRVEATWATPSWSRARTFARFLVETGVCKDTSEVFRKYLTEGKPGYVPHRWASLGNAVHLDHPGRGWP